MTANRLPLNISEASLQSSVMDLSALRGWRRVHVRAARTEKGYRTPYEGDSGLPDLILARSGVVRLVELKAQQRQPTPEQRAWLAAAGEFGHLWRPSSWAEICEVLR